MTFYCRLKRAAAGFIPAAAFFCLSFFANNTSAQGLASIIIDDIGDDLINSHAAINLKNNFTYAVLPDSENFTALAQQIVANHNELMLHVPMQSIDSRLVNKETLNIHMTEAQFTAKLRHYLSLSNSIAGINNHMGSLLTLHPAFMQLTMQILHEHQAMYFIDSMTHAKSVAMKIAHEKAVPAMKRDFFLDNIRAEAEINKQFMKFINLANIQGHALAICHPYPETITFLKQNISKLSQHGIKLVPTSILIKSTQEKQHEQSTRTASAGL